MHTRCPEKCGAPRAALLMLALLSLGGAASCAAESGRDAPGSAGEARAALETTETCITIQRGLSGDVADALVNSGTGTDGSATNNYGGSCSLTAGGNGSGERRALLRFDLGAIPQGATITSASATLNVLLPGGAPVQAHRVTAPWSESTVTWASFAGTFSPTVEATFPGTSPASASLTSLVQAWVNGAVPNNGIVLEREIGGSTVFAGSECQESLRPKLDVCYGPPEPASVLLVVADAGGNPVPMALVDVDGATHLADSAGRLLVDQLSPGRRVLRIKAGGYASATVVVDLPSGAHVGTEARLLPFGAPLLLDAVSGGTLTKGGVVVSIPPGALVDGQGQPVSGTVDVTIVPFDGANPGAFPGPMQAVLAGSGDIVPLETLFMAEVSVTQDGNAVQLAPGAWATLELALPTSVPAKFAVGTNVPAFWFDTSQGRWVEDGLGTIAQGPAPGSRKWVADVGHFTWWSADQWLNTECYAVTVLDAGVPATAYPVTITGLDYTGGTATGYTDGAGHVCLEGMKGGVVRIRGGFPGHPVGAPIDVVGSGNVSRCGGGGAPCTPIALVAAPQICTPGTWQIVAPYSGPPGTEDVGICSAAKTYCDAAGLGWTAVAEVLPGAETCDWLDNNCDGQVDEGCNCTNGATQSCYDGPAGTLGVGACQAGMQTCVNGHWGACAGEVLPAAEACTALGQPAVDEDCNGQVDEVGCGYVAISGGSSHSLGVRFDGSVWAWGHNGYGQLGDGTTTSRTTPVQVQGLTNVTAVAAGAPYSLALRSDGSVWAWGYNGSGQLGDGTTTNRSTPVLVQGLTNITAVAAGVDHALALRSDGSVWAWGANDWGQLGDGTTTRRTTPVQLSGLTSVLAVAAGRYHTLALRADGSVWAWGDYVPDPDDIALVFAVKTPVQVPGLTNVTAVAAGGDRAFAARADGSVWIWGNSNGQPTTTPVQVQGLTNVTAVAAGDGHALALRSDRSVWAWGANSAGQLGDGTTTGPGPVQVHGLTNITAVAAGSYHSLAVRSDGSVWAWGGNTAGQLGDGTTTGRKTPVELLGLTNVTAIASGLWSSLALRSDGSVWAWGNNQFGQLGDGTTTGRSSPVLVQGLTGVTAVAAGYWHSLALRSDGSVRAWGGNHNGQLGDGTTTNRTIHVGVQGLTGVTALAAGGTHSLALRSDGLVWAWGDNGFGQLGDGTTAQRATPVQVVGLTNVTALAAGGPRSLALRADGSVWAWGGNGYGQIGDGTTTQRTTPVQVVGLTNVTAIAAGSYHSLALLSDGSVWAWGEGWLSNGSNTNRTTPVLVPGLANVTAIAAGESHSLAVRSDQSIWAWGYNVLGQLGDGTTTPRGSPVLVLGLANATAVAAGNGHSVAVRSDQSAWAWGDNQFGQLGINPNLWLPVQTLLP